MSQPIDQVAAHCKAVGERRRGHEIIPAFINLCSGATPKIYLGFVIIYYFVLSDCRVCCIEIDNFNRGHKWSPLIVFLVSRGIIYYYIGLAGVKECSGRECA